MDQAEVWIVIAAYREAQSVEAVVREVAAQFPHVVVVDDGSPDETAAHARRGGATVLRHAINLGQGAALQTGIDYALQCGAKYIVTFDADGQHRVADIGVLLEALRTHDADIAFGSRFLGHASGISAWRRCVLKAAVLFTFAATGLKMTDAHNGLRALTRSAAMKIRLRHNGMAHASEIISQTASLRLRFVEAPITVLYTEYSLAKGQRLGNAVHIVLDLIGRRLQ